jgi:hypothetical protein
MTRKMEESRSKADIHPDGSANEAAVVVAMNTLLLQALNNEPAEPVLFLPHELQKTGYPVKLTDVKVANDSIRLTVVPLNAQERKELLESLRKPYAKAEKAGQKAKGQRTAAERSAAQRSVASPDARPVVE